MRGARRSIASERSKTPPRFFLTMTLSLAGAAAGLGIVLPNVAKADGLSVQHAEVRLNNSSSLSGTGFLLIKNEGAVPVTVQNISCECTTEAHLAAPVVIQPNETAEVSALQLNGFINHPNEAGDNVNLDLAFLAGEDMRVPAMIVLENPDAAHEEEGDFEE